MSAISTNRTDKLVQSLGVLIVDDNQYMRKVVRTLLVNIGVRKVYEASDGIAGLDAIRIVTPDVVIIDWELPLLNGAEFVRIVRSPGVFPFPTFRSSCFLRMASAGAWSRRCASASTSFCKQAGIGQTLLDRLTPSCNAAPVVQLGDYYGPAPRKWSFEPVAETLDGVLPDDTPLN